MTFPRPFHHFRPHPWHGLEVGPDPPRVLHAYVEITPFDLMKYEVDKTTGYLKVDRPQRTSSLPPTLYGFVPRTYCGRRVAALSPATERADGDPLDICVLSERPIARAEVLLRVRVVGGIQVVDSGEADDKIVAVLDGDPVWAETSELAQVPPALVERLAHYFATYKLRPGAQDALAVQPPYGREHAWRVVEAAIADYLDEASRQPGSGSA